jgi:5-formaminoimidazole-4-carboxamide-1-(beta)-D-ribofuranosyl 5'-monophosphate synthetase
MKKVDIRRKALEILSGYDQDRINMGTVCSHSALETFSGAHRFGFDTVGVLEEGREDYYLTQAPELMDNVIVVKKFGDIAGKTRRRELESMNVVWIPNRAYSTYVSMDNIEQTFSIPHAGSRNLLKTEERGKHPYPNQTDLLRVAGIRTPFVFDSPDKINRLALVKAQDARNPKERAFYWVNNLAEYDEKTDILKKKGIITDEILLKSEIQAVILGNHINANFLYSPIESYKPWVKQTSGKFAREERVGRLWLLGFEKRNQSNRDGYLGLAAQDQITLDKTGFFAQNVEAGHYGVTSRESILPEYIDAARKWIKVCSEVYAPGQIGIFSLQGIVDKDLKFWVYDVSPRFPGAPPIGPTSPYIINILKKAYSGGDMIARMIKMAIKQKQLDEIIT